MKQNKKIEKQRKNREVSLNSAIGEYLQNLEEDIKKKQAKAGKGTRPFDTQRGLCSVWKKIAPEYLQEHTDNVVYSTKSKETEILVYTDDPAYAAELNMDKELYRLRMQKELGKEVSNIKFLVSRKTAQRKKNA